MSETPVLDIPRIVIGGVQSGSGKTTVACAILQALLERGLRPAAFKCGPDYIDPMFHSGVIGVGSRNLDLFFCEPPTVQALAARHSAGHGIAVIEGVMGYYDGVGGTHQASTCHLAQVTASPAVLVVEPKGMALSAAALLQGFAGFLPDSRVRGVIFNRCPPGLYPLLKGMVERHTALTPLGFLPPMPEAAFESRHLGLLTAGEVANLRQKLALLAEQCRQTVDLDGLLALARTAPPLEAPPLCQPQPVPGRPLVAVAKDEAFCFLYEDNLDFLRACGLELAFFSPLKDACLPEGASGLLLPGGYPELHARRLAGNTSMLQSIREAMQGGLPTIAECGGFLYLHQQLEDDRGHSHLMAGVIAGSATRGQRLGRFGYVTLTARSDSLLCRAGESLRGHEFHYWQSENPGSAFTAVKSSGATWNCVHASGSLYAGFPHLYFYANPGPARRFAAACAAYRPEAKGAVR